MSVYTYKCPNCGGGLNFDPKTQYFICEFCGSEFTKEEMETNKPEEAKIQSNQEETLLYSCPSCGAEVITDETTAATECFFCHSSVVLSDRLTGKFSPDEVIPFTVQKERAIEGLMEWIKKKRFVPKAFTCERQLEKITGVYFPIWYVDCEVEGAVDARGTKVRVWQDSNFRYTETRFFKVSRNGEVGIKQIPKEALTKVESELYKSVLPFDESKAVPFTSAYLSGFQAEKRNVEKETLIKIVDDEAKHYAKQLLDETISGYATITNSNYQMNLKNMDWKYTLLPVWVMTYKDTKKTYYYVMNGQTGKINGKLPVDKKKLGWTSAGISTVVFIILMLFTRGGIS